MDYSQQVLDWAKGTRLAETGGPKGYTMGPNGPLKTPGGLRPGQIGASGPTEVPVNPRRLPVPNPRGGLPVPPASKIIETTGRVLPNAAREAAIHGEQVGDFASDAARWASRGTKTAVASEPAVNALRGAGLVGGSKMLLKAAGTATIPAQFAQGVGQGSLYLGGKVQDRDLAIRTPAEREAMAKRNEVMGISDSATKAWRAGNNPFVSNKMTMLPSHGKTALGVIPTPTMESVRQAGTPSAPVDVVADPNGVAIVDGNRINYRDIGNPLKDAALINSRGYSFGIGPTYNDAAQKPTPTILDQIKSIQPVESYASRMTALNNGNDTWDMNGIDKILAAKAGQQADEAMYQQQLSALGQLGVGQMNADAARYGHDVDWRKNQANIAANAPHLASEVEKNQAEAAMKPIQAKSEVLKALKEQAKDSPGLQAGIKSLETLHSTGDRVGYNQVARKIAEQYGIIIPPLPLTEG